MLWFSIESDTYTQPQLAKITDKHVWGISKDILSTKQAEGQCRGVVKKLNYSTVTHLAGNISCINVYEI